MIYLAPGGKELLFFFCAVLFLLFLAGGVAGLELTYSGPALVNEHWEGWNFTNCQNDCQNGDYTYSKQIQNTVDISYPTGKVCGPVITDQQSSSNPETACYTYEDQASGATGTDCTLPSNSASSSQEIFGGQSSLQNPAAVDIYGNMRSSSWGSTFTFNNPNECENPGGIYRYNSSQYSNFYSELSGEGISPASTLHIYSKKSAERSDDMGGLVVYNDTKQIDTTTGSCSIEKPIWPIILLYKVSPEVSFQGILPLNVCGYGIDCHASPIYYADTNFGACDYTTSNTTSDGLIYYQSCNSPYDNGKTVVSSGISPGGGYGAWRGDVECNIKSLIPDGTAWSVPGIGCTSGYWADESTVEGLRNSLLQNLQTPGVAYSVITYQPSEDTPPPFDCSLGYGALQDWAFKVYVRFSQVGAVNLVSPPVCLSAPGGCGSTCPDGTIRQGVNCVACTYPLVWRDGQCVNITDDRNCELTPSPSPADINPITNKATVSWTGKLNGTSVGTPKWNIHGNSSSGPDWNVMTNPVSIDYNKVFQYYAVAEYSDNTGSFMCTNNVNVRNPLSVSCVGSPNPAPLVNGSVDVNWIALPAGGNGTYDYNWFGTNTPQGTTNLITQRYNTAGKKTANIEVTDSDGTKVISSCDVNVGIIVSCAANPNPAFTNSPVNWVANVVGGTEPFSYSWNNNGGSKVKSVVYDSNGIKDENVVVTDSSTPNITGAASCSVDVNPGFNCTINGGTCVADACGAGQVHSNGTCASGFICCAKSISTTVVAYCKGTQEHDTNNIIWDLNITAGSPPFYMDWNFHDGNFVQDTVVNFGAFSRKENYLSFGTQQLDVNVVSADGNYIVASCYANVSSTNESSFGRCDITNFSVTGAVIGEDINGVYSCSSTDANLTLVDIYGASFFTVNNLPCNNNSTFSHSLDSSIKSGVYAVRLTTGNCSKKVYFKVSTSGRISGVPDNNLLALAGLLALVLVIVFPRKRK